MSALSDRFSLLKSNNERALVLFVTAGDPDLKELPAILETLAEAGADAIEVGIPFSDPIADGPTIQAASQRALDRGVTPRAILDTLNGFDRCPLILMGYINPMIRMGLDQFADAALAAGASGTIVCDVIPEEADAWIEVSRPRDLDTIFLAAPTSTDDRLERVCKASSGFVYAVSRTGVTGTNSTAANEAESIVARLRPHTNLPICVGFGISTPDQVRAVCQVADGAVVGSSLVDQIAREWQGGAGKAAIKERVAALKAATRS